MADTTGPAEERISKLRRMFITLVPGVAESQAAVPDGAYHAGDDPGAEPPVAAAPSGPAGRPRSFETSAGTAGATAASAPGQQLCTKRRTGPRSKSDQPEENTDVYSEAGSC